MNKLVASVALAALTLATVPAAHADPGASDSPGERVDVSYRSQILATDAAAVIITSLGGDKLGDVGIATAMLGGPLVHLVHGNTGRAFASLGLRGGLALGGAALGAALCDPNPYAVGVDCVGEATVGGIVGYGAAAILDATVLAHQTREAKPSTWSPQVAIARGGVRVGLGGTF